MEYLDEKELQIFYGELQGRRKSTGIAYLLLLVGAALGLHQWYLGKWFPAMGYIAMGIVVFGSQVLGFTAIAADKAHSASGFVLIAFGFGILFGLCFFIDLCTLGIQVKSKNDSIRSELLAEIRNRQKGFKEFN